LTATDHSHSGHAGAWVHDGPDYRPPAAVIVPPPVGRAGPYRFGSITAAASGARP